MVPFADVGSVSSVTEPVVDGGGYGLARRCCRGLMSDGLIDGARRVRIDVTV